MVVDYNFGRMKKLRPVENDMERLIPLTPAARMLGLSPDTLRNGYVSELGLTLIDQSRPGAQRRRFFMVFGEVVEHRRKLIDEARRRTDVTRMLRK